MSDSIFEVQHELVNGHEVIVIDDNDPITDDELELYAAELEAMYDEEDLRHFQAKQDGRMQRKMMR